MVELEETRCLKAHLQFVELVGLPYDIAICYLVLRTFDLVSWSCPYSSRFVNIPFHIKNAIGIVYGLHSSVPTSNKIRSVPNIKVDVTVTLQRLPVDHSDRLKLNKRYASSIRWWERQTNMRKTPQ